MIRGQITNKKADLNSLWPKAYVPSGDFEETIILESASDLTGKPATAIYVEPLEEGWGVDGELVLSGTDGTKSFIVVYPTEGSPTTTQAVQSM